jgi:C4-dicarboxylate-specific signal transduction histidine kinase
MAGEPLSLAAQKQEIQNLRAELREQVQLADVGELAGQLTHKFNNFLNSLLLKLALLETEHPELASGRLAEVKNQAKGMADVIKQIHHFQRRQTATQVLDLNTVITRVSQAISPEAGKVSIDLELSPEPAAVAASSVDLHRLFYFLLHHRLAAAGSARRSLVLRTAVTDKVVASMQDDTWALPAAALASLFDGDAKNADGGISLDLAACKALVRRHQGRIHARSIEPVGVIIDAEFPPAPPRAAGH